MSILKQLAAGTADIKLDKKDLNLGDAPTAITSNSVATALNTVYMWAAILAVLIIIIGGIRYATANGDSAQVKSAKNTILYAVVGLVVIIMATAITDFVIKNIAK
jgi:uncharacterized membrane protein YidH (DUF202 family)